jgi:hypothetical protein
MQPEFYPDELKALLPWRGFVPSRRAIIVGTLTFSAVLASAWYFDGPDFSIEVIAAGLVGIGLFLAAALLLRRTKLASAVAMDAEGIAASSLLGRKYFAWRDVRTVAHVHSLSIAQSPIVFNLVIFPRSGRRPTRLPLPDLDGNERDQLFTILERISKRSGFALISDHSADGREALSRLPNYWP